MKRSIILGINETSVSPENSCGQQTPQVHNKLNGNHEIWGDRPWTNDSPEFKNASILRATLLSINYETVWFFQLRYERIISTYSHKVHEEEHRQKILIMSLRNKISSD